MNDKKFESKSIEVRYFSRVLYRYTYHKGSELIEIEMMNKVGFWKKWQWVRIYLGFPDRLQDALTFYNETKNSSL